MRLTKWINGRIGKQNDEQEFDLWEIDVIKKLAAYEDTGLEPEQIAEYLNATDEYVRASEEGRLIVLPCKVGDTVYLLERFCDGSIGDCDSWVSCEECDDYKQQIYPRRIVSVDAAFAVIGMLGKTVFLTREEAEAALKGEGTEE